MLEKHQNTSNNKRKKIGKLDYIKILNFSVLKDTLNGVKWQTAGWVENICK